MTHLNRLAASAAMLAAFASAPALAQAGQGAVQQLTRAQATQQVDEQFKQTDTNSDGKLSRAEIDAAFAKGAAAAQAELRAQAKEVFDKLDTNHNNQLSLAEFQAQATLTPKPGVAEARMKQLDANSDGSVTAAEFRAATLTQFDRLDANHDGVVTAAEDAAAQGGSR